MTSKARTSAEFADELFATGQRLAGSTGSPTLARFVGRLGSRLNKPPRIVLIGEFNSGKSTLANALIGAEVLPTSIHANTRVPLLVHYSPTPSLMIEDHDLQHRPLSLDSIVDVTRGSARMLRLGLPLPRLQNFELIDTPGLAQGSFHIDDLGLEACRRSHIAVWCTVATQAWKASEQAIWHGLPSRLRSRSILAVTHKDAIRSERDAGRLMQRLQADAGSQFSRIAMVAASEALAAATTSASPETTEQWTESGGAELESCLTTAIEAEFNARQTSAARLIERMTQRLVAAASRSRAPIAT